MRVYVAGRTTDLTNVVPIAEALKDEGHTITFEWWGAEGEIRTDLVSADLELVVDHAIHSNEVREPEQWESTVRHKPTNTEATGTGHSKVAAHDVAVNKLRGMLNAGWRSKPKEAGRLGAREIQAVRDADAVVLVWAPDILGAAIETGAAIALEKLVFVYRSGRDSVFWYMDGVRQIDTKAELLDALREEDENYAEQLKDLGQI
jgi:nucleoside 2-deoxyribosyltransferase